MHQTVYSVWLKHLFSLNDRFPLSCDPLRTPQLAIRSWSRNFSNISGLNTRWCESIRSYTICCALMGYGHDWSISGDMSCHDLISRSDTITYVPIGLSWSRPWLGLDHHDLGRSATCRYVTIRSSRTDALCCDWIRLWTRCLSRSRSRVITIWATIGPRRVKCITDSPGFVGCLGE